jgi:hypothetical protein
MSSPSGTGQSPVPVESQTPSVTRSQVPSGRPYHEYKPFLQQDFLCSCAYCTMSEAEAQAIRFTIDHYEPRKIRPDLQDIYHNLMYACDECNRRKGDRSPPPEAREAGHRFFRPDHDVHSSHFTAAGIRLEAKTNTGKYSILALDLNRQGLRRLRELRQRLIHCEVLAAQGVRGLLSYPIDRLPPEVRAKALVARRSVATMQTKIVSEIEDILMAYARSSVLDDEPKSEEEIRERAEALKSIEGLYPGNWRTPRKPAP